MWHGSDRRSREGEAQELPTKRARTGSPVHPSASPRAASPAPTAGSSASGKPRFNQGATFFPAFRRIIRPDVPRDFSKGWAQQLKQELMAFLESLTYVEGDPSKLSVTAAKHKIDGASRRSLQVGEGGVHTPTLALPVHPTTTQGRARLNTEVQQWLDDFAQRHGAYITWHTASDVGLYDWGLVGTTLQLSPYGRPDLPSQTYRVTDVLACANPCGAPLHSELHACAHPVYVEPLDKAGNSQGRRAVTLSKALEYAVKIAEDDPKYEAEPLPAAAHPPPDSLTLQVGTRFMWQGKAFKVSAMNPRARKFPVEAFQVDTDPPRLYRFARIVEGATLLE